MKHSELNLNLGITHASQARLPQHYALSAVEFERLRDRLAIYSGIYLDSTQQRMLELGLARRLAARACDYAQYEQILVADWQELARLTELVVNHETFFFRNQPHMHALHNVILPELDRRKPKGEPVRIWSAGCATGEEAYSLAIVALEALPFSTRPIEIWATDLSEPALTVARTGFYSGRALANVTPDRLTRHFLPCGDGHLVGEQARALVTFERYNLIDPLPQHVRGTDIIFCQNVLIYFQAAITRVILGKFHDLLSDDGMLFLGFSETIWNRFDAFHTREVSGAFVYYKEAYAPVVAKRAAGPLHSPMPRRPVTQPMVSPAARTGPKRSPEPAAGSDSEGEALLRQGEALVASGQLIEALRVLQGISPKSSVRVAAMTLIARIHANAGQIDLALIEAQHAVELEPLHGEAALLLGILYARQSQWDAAVVQLERARYLNNMAPLVSFHLAETYRQQARFDAAMREYRNALRKLQPYPPDTVIDGVAVGWLRETCQQQITQLSQHNSEH